MKKIRAIAKLIMALSFLAVFFFLLTILVYPLYKFRPYKFRPLLNKLVSKAVVIVNFIIGLKVKVKGLSKLPEENFLYVSNHLSYLDIFSISRFLNLSYITSFEMKETLGLGQIVEITGCVFVERRREKRDRNNRDKELGDIKKSMESNINIGLFPEATSHNGLEILPFKKPMFIPAFQLGKPVVVGVLNYQSLSGERLSLKNKDKVCWHGSMNFEGHFFSFLKERGAIVELEVLEVLYPKNFETLELLVAKSEELVNKHFKLIKE